MKCLLLNGILGKTLQSIDVYLLNYSMAIWLWRQPPTQRCGMHLPILTHSTFPSLATRTQIPSIWDRSTELQLPVQWDAFIPPIWISSCLQNLLHPPFQFNSELNTTEGKVLHLPCIGAYHSWWRIRTLIKRPLDWKRRREVEMQNFSLLSGTPHDPTLLWLSSLHFILFESHPHT